jgi:hypothetical protein
MTPEPKKPRVLTHQQCLELLSEQAQAGSVTATAALERALRAVARGEPTGDELDRELADLVK